MKQPLDWTKIGLYGAAALAAVILGASLSVLIYGLDEPAEGRSTGLAASGAPVEAAGQGPIGGPFSLVDEDGARRTEAVLEGEVSLVYFGFARCPDYCPRELDNLAVAKAQMEAAGLEPQILFVSVDPERDTPETLKEFVDYFDPDIVGLTGTPEEVAAIAGAYRAFYERVDDPDTPGDYVINHTTLVYAMGPDGRYATHFSALTPPDVIAERLLETFAERRAE